MSERKCECGMDSHMNQITEYPVGATVVFSDNTTGIVTGHCDDGRATIEIGGETHTFHRIHTWVDRVVLPGDDVATLKARIAELEGTIATLTGTVAGLETIVSVYRKHTGG